MGDRLYSITLIPKTKGARRLVLDPSLAGPEAAGVIFARLSGSGQRLKIAFGRSCTSGGGPHGGPYMEFRADSGNRGPNAAEQVARILNQLGTGDFKRLYSTLEAWKAKQRQRAVAA